ncbi:MAG TPA: hypothetical protein VMT73_04735 [Anaerolineales bacterium]|nr:hypothetical protein [Anaerolineales bacterium]
MNRRLIFQRILISVVLGLLLGWLLSEITFVYIQDTARPPRSIVLVIPAGTAAAVARGEQPPAIPESMNFVQGDTLVVKNEDTENHQLGPLWIPPGTSASLQLGTVENLAYECSFQPRQYFGINVYEPLTPSIRLEGVLEAGVPMGFLFSVYSILVLPKKSKVVAS